MHNTPKSPLALDRRRRAPHSLTTHSRATFDMETEGGEGEVKALLEQVTDVRALFLFDETDAMNTQFALPRLTCFYFL